MALFPAAPKIHVRAPTACFVGQTCTVELELLAVQPTTIEFVEARVVGEQGWKIGAGKNRITHKIKYPRFVTRLAGASVLPVGTTRLVASFVLPPDMPPSHQVAPAWARLDLEVHVSIPWWPDGRARFELKVRWPQPGPVARTPVLMRSRAAVDEPRIELSLASSRLIAGEMVHGTIAVFHLDDRKPHDIAISVMPALVLHGRWRDRERRGDGMSTTVTLPAGSAGSGIPFRFQLPAALPPSFRSPTHTMAWQIEASLGSFFGTRLAIATPIEIIDAGAAASTAQLTAAPQLGDDRITASFAHFATAHGWETPRDDAAQLAIERATDAGQLRIEYAYRGEAGTFVVASITHRSLGLDLNVAPSSGLRHVFFEDIEVDIAAWDRANHVTARSPDQAIPVLASIVPTQVKLAGILGALVHWDDDSIVFERAVVDLDAPQLAAIHRALDELASTIAAAQRTVAPPLGITLDVAAWHELARSLSGELTVGNLSIVGRLDVVPVELGLAWDEHGRATRIDAVVGDSEVASDNARAIAIEVARPAADGFTLNASEPILAQLAGWPADFIHLRITDGVASASCLLPAGDAPEVSATRARELVLALRSLLALLDPGAGPYR